MTIFNIGLRGGSKITFKYKSTTHNKRGDCINYKPLFITNDLFNELFTFANEILPKKYIDLIKSEYVFFKNIVGQTEEAKDKFNMEHPFWAKECYYLFEAYCKLWEMWSWKSKNSSKNSKNIFACNDLTCISSIQQHGRTLIVTSRSCDLSLGFLADCYTIMLLAQDNNINDINWLIQCPHIYYNNYKKTLEYFSNPKETKREFIFNIRKNF